MTTTTMIMVMMSADGPAKGTDPNGGCASVREGLNRV